MKKLILMRHAKSCWDLPWQDDHERPLAERGIRDAPIMAQKLLNRGIQVDSILSSSANRALLTANKLVEELKLSPEIIQIEHELYHAPPQIIIKYLQSQKESVETLVLIGHNPGLNELIQLFGTKIDNLPTSGQIGFILELNHWKRLTSKKYKFWFLDFPKKYA